MFSEKCTKSYHIKKGDVVEVLSGVWKKETGKITAVIKKTDRVVLEIQSVAADKLAERVGKKTIKRDLFRSMFLTSGRKTDRRINYA